MKSGSLTTTLTENGHSRIALCRRKWWPSQDWRSRRFGIYLVGSAGNNLLPYGQTLNLDLYCQQLDRHKRANDQKRPALANERGTVFHQDSARPHTLIVARYKLRDLSWEVLMYPPSDYYLFLFMANDFCGEKFASWETCENRLPLQGRRLEVIKQSSAYFT